MPVEHASNALSDDEAERLRAALSEPEREREPDDDARSRSEAPPAVAEAASEAGTEPDVSEDARPEGTYVLVGKASVSVRGRKVTRGGVVPGAWVAGLSARRRAYFDEMERD